jgi:hypothetical protein
MMMLRSAADSLADGQPRHAADEHADDEAQRA